MQPRRFETRSLDEASAIMAREWSRHDIAAPGAMSMRFATTALTPDVSINHLAYGTSVVIRPLDRDAVILVQIPVSGSARASFGPSSVAIDSSSHAVLDVRSLSRATFDADFEMVALRIRISRVLAHLESLLGRRAARDLAFSPTIAAGSAAWSTWHPVVGALRSMCADGGRMPPALREAWETTILSALLHSQPNSYTDDLRRPAVAIAPRHVRRAEEFIEAHADASLTTGRVARHVGVSVRALFDGFMAFRGLSPADHIRSVRLARARADLLSGGCTVSEAASRWGFAHAGYFAACYKRRYGEAPSRTRTFGC